MFYEVVDYWNNIKRFAQLEIWHNQMGKCFSEEINIKHVSIKNTKRIEYQKLIQA
jgi:glucan biosynthesis protein